MLLILQTSFRQHSPETRLEAGALHLQLGTQSCAPGSTTLPQKSKEMAEPCQSIIPERPEEGKG